MAAFISHIKPDQTLIIVAFLGLFIGLLLWLEGFRIARPALTMVLAALGAFWGYLAPVIWHLPIVNIAGAIVMAIIGAILGSIGFRFMQAVLVAALVAVTILSAFAVQQPVAAKPRAKPASGHVAKPPAASARRRPDARMWQIWNNAQTRSQAWWKMVLQMPPARRSKAQEIAFGSALAALLLGLLFWRSTTVVASACVGTVVLVLSLMVLSQAFVPKLLAHWLGRVNLLWLVLGAAGGGILLQWAQVLHQNHHQKKETVKKAEAKKAA